MLKGAGFVAVAGCVEIGRDYGLLPGIAAAKRGGQRGRAFFQVPGFAAILGGAADADGVDAVGVPVTAATVVVLSTVAGCPHVDRTQTTSSLQSKGHEN